MRGISVEVTRLKFDCPMYCVLFHLFIGYACVSTCTWKFRTFSRKIVFHITALSVNGPNTPKKKEKIRELVRFIYQV